MKAQYLLPGFIWLPDKDSGRKAYMLKLDKELKNHFSYVESKQNKQRGYHQGEFSKGSALALYISRYLGDGIYTSDAPDILDMFFEASEAHGRRSDIIYLLIMLVLALVVISGYAVKVFPAFERVIPTQRWPTVTQVLYSFGSSLYNGLWIYFLIFFIAAYIIIVLLLNNLTGNLRNNVLDRIIPFSIYKKMVCSVFISNLSSMLKNKVPINDSLTVLSQNANRWLYAHINTMLDNMARGDTYKDALNTGLLGKEEILNVSIYSGLPSFSDVLAAVALKARKDLAQAISRLSGLLKSLSTLVLGGCVVWVFVALFALSDTLSKMTSF